MLAKISTGNKGSIIFKGLMGLSLFAIFFALFVFAPNINSTLLGIDVSAMSNDTQWLFRLGILGIAFTFLFWWLSDVA